MSPDTISAIGLSCVIGFVAGVLLTVMLAWRRLTRSSAESEEVAQMRANLAESARQIRNLLDQNDRLARQLAGAVTALRCEDTRRAGSVRKGAA